VPDKERKSSRGSSTVQQLLTNPGRKKSIAHVYSALFYESHIKHLVDYDKYLESITDGSEPMPKFAHRNYCIRKAWETAPAHLRQHAIKYKELSEMSLEELEGLLSDDGVNGKRCVSTRSIGIAHSREYQLSIN
jgi:hypothetical protein